MVSEEAMDRWLKSPSEDTDKAVDIIEAAAGGDLDSAFKRFLGVMGGHDRLLLLPEVSELFAELREEAENRLKVRVVSAVALEDDQTERMRTALARRFDREIELHNEVDAKVLGGAVIYAGDEVIDGSLRGRLQKLTPWPAGKLPELTHSTCSDTGRDRKETAFTGKRPCKQL